MGIATDGAAGATPAVRAGSGVGSHARPPAQHAPAQQVQPHAQPLPVALVVFLENLGRLGAMALPGWVTATVDFVAEEYTKLVLRLHGVHRRYDRVLILEDARATGADLRAALVALSRTHTVDLLVLSHGNPNAILGYKGQAITAGSFGPLIAQRQANPALLNLRAVWQMNCHGATMLPTWMALGARSVCGTPGVNWLPEPALSLFVRRWLRGEPFSQAVTRSGAASERIWRRVYRPSAGAAHARLASSRPVVFGHDTDFGSDRNPRHGVGAAAQRTSPAP